MSKFKALVFDIDGTAVANSREAMPSPRLVAAIQAARGSLELFAASGRSTPFAIPVLKALGLTNPCIIGGGTTLINPVSGAIIDQSLLSISTVTQIRDALIGLSYTIHPPSIAGTYRPSLADRIDQPYPYLGVSKVAEGDITPILQALSHVPGVVAAAAPDWDGNFFVQITDKDATKENRIRHVLDTLGTSPAYAIGVGDADNDIHLFAAVGHRVAMGNATDQLKSIADEIAPDITEDGLAHIIEKYSRP